MPLYNSSEVFVPAKQYGNTIHNDSLDIKKTERDALLCLCSLLIISSSEVSFFKQKTAYEIGVRLVGSEMCIRDRQNWSEFLTHIGIR